jgi:ATP adenylyltransferase
MIRAMSVPSLHAPWRMAYIKSLGNAKKDDKCFLCEASATTDPKRLEELLVLWQTELSVVMLNRYPYANGHLLVAPRLHKGELEELSSDELLDMQVQTTRVVALLKRAVSAQGFNIGINLGRVAGAGLPGHLHQHIVPRWGGDINFMHVIGEVGVVPETNSQLYAELMRISREIRMTKSESPNECRNPNDE